MERRIEDVQYCERLFQSFYDIGSTFAGRRDAAGGIRETEDAMHEVFKGPWKGARGFCDYGRGWGILM